jgi:hypothetical protein
MRGEGNIVRSLIVAAALAFAVPATAEVSPAHQPAALDALLSAKDYRALTATIRSGSTQEDVKSDLDWLRAKLVDGESALVSMLYARMLWDSAAELPAQNSGRRKTAAFAILYAYATIQIDGVRCDDATAPSRRIDQLVMMIPELRLFFAALSEADRAAIAERVVEIEQSTAQRRDQQGDVKFLCSGGMDEMAYNLEHGSSREMPANPDGWKRIEVIGDGSYKPSERPEAEWKAEAARQRASLPAKIAEVIAALSANPPAK